MITLVIILCILLAIACCQVAFHTRLNDEDGARIARLEGENRDLTRRNTELELKSEMDERLILTLAQDIAGAKVTVVNVDVAGDFHPGKVSAAVDLASRRGARA